MNRSAEALESIALVVIRYDYGTTGKVVTSETIEATVMKCSDVIGGLVYGDKLEAINSLSRRLLPPGRR